jgi:hypothetical protein
MNPCSRRVNESEFWALDIFFLVDLESVFARLNYGFENFGGFGIGPTSYNDGNVVVGDGFEERCVVGYQIQAENWNDLLRGQRRRFGR